MIELYGDISPEIREAAETAWKIAQSQFSPNDAAKFLHDATEYIRNTCSDRDAEFFQFYFNVQMEMMKT